MNERLHILHLEDEPDFAELVRSLLAMDGLEADVIRVGTLPEFEKSLADGKFDLIVSDYHLPGFTGLDALVVAKKKAPHIPFILVSGTIGEQAAIESLRAGATDYVLKQTPERLPSAIRRAVKESAEAAKLREAELELKRREKYFRTLTENSLDILCIINREGKLAYVSPSARNVLGYPSEELRGEDVLERVHQEDQYRAREALQMALANPDRTIKVQFRYKTKGGDWRRLEIVEKNCFDDPEINGIVASCRDVSDRWRAEEELRDSERQYRLLFQSNPNPMWVFDLESQSFLEVNEAAIQYYGYSREEFLKMTIGDIRPPEKNGTRKISLVPDTGRGLIWKHRKKNGDLIDVEVIWSAEMDDSIGILHNSKIAENALALLDAEKHMRSRCAREIVR